MGSGLFSGLPKGHALRSLLEEHDAIWRLVDRLDSLGEILQERRDGFEELLLDLLCLIHYLNRTEVHERREDRGLFAALDALGQGEDIRLVRATHARAAVLRQRLRSLAAPAGKEPRASDLDPICRLIRELAQATRVHLEQEEQVVFPLALRVLSEVTWARLARDLTAAGPCPFRMRYVR